MWATGETCQAETDRLDIGTGTEASRLADMVGDER
jgi:hypothetical protein